MTIKLVSDEKIAETSSKGNQEKWYSSDTDSWYNSVKMSPSSNEVKWGYNIDQQVGVQSPTSLKRLIK